jgi:hypothetical protein
MAFFIFHSIALIKPTACSGSYLIFLKFGRIAHVACDSPSPVYISTSFFSLNILRKDTNLNKKENAAYDLHIQSSALNKPPLFSAAFFPMLAKIDSIKLIKKLNTSLKLT